MSGYVFLDEKGTFRLQNPDQTGYLYFPIAGENGLKGALTPKLQGDLKMDQNTFVLQPVSAEDLAESKAGRNFWCVTEDGICWSAAGNSAQAEMERFAVESGGEKGSGVLPDTSAEEKNGSETMCGAVLTAGPMWQCVTRTDKRTQLEARITSFVPVTDRLTEMMVVQIKNTGDHAVRFSPIAAVPLYARSADNIRDHRHVTSLLHRIATTRDGVFVHPTLTFDERGHQVNTKTYFVTGCEGNGRKPIGFCPVLEDFVGEGGSLLWPERVVRNLPFEEPGREYAGYEAIGALRFADVTLQPGEESAYLLRIGMTEEASPKGGFSGGNSSVTENTSPSAEPVGTLQAAWDALQITKDYWASRIRVETESGNREFDHWMYWVTFQPILRRIYGCSFLPHHDYGKGGRGWRDLWQDCLALLIMNPDGVRQMIIDNCAGVRFDGTNATIIGNRPGEFIADRNNITRVWMDHGFWPLFTVKFYLDQTGDFSVLQKECTYFKDRQEMRGTAADESFVLQDHRPVLRNQNGKVHTGTVLEHLLIQNLTAFYETGDHGHIRLRDADWNDALDMAPEKGESVAFTAAYAMNLETLSEILMQMRENTGMDQLEISQELEILFTAAAGPAQSETAGEGFSAGSQKKQEILKAYCKSCYPAVSGRSIFLDTEYAAGILAKMADQIRDHIRKNEWIQDQGCSWFNSYYDNHGNAVEGIFGEERRMMLTGQVFTVMSRTADKEQTAQIVRAADRLLYEKKLGGYRLNTDFKEVKTDMGRMFGFAYGHKENGAVFSHMAVMFGNALYRNGFAREGYKALNSLFEQASNFEVSRIYPGIPEYFNDRGRGMYHYLTGAASWMLMTVVTQMYGIRGDFGDLLLEPKLLKSQFDASGRAGLRTEFAHRNWHIVYCSREGLDYGEYVIQKVWIDGSAQKVPEACSVFRITQEQIGRLSARAAVSVEVELGRR